jgi:hypothetical protein
MSDDIVKVRDLIELLKKIDPDYEVHVEDQYLGESYPMRQDSPYYEDKEGKRIIF